MQKKDDTSETYFRNLLESAPDAMIIVDDKATMTIVNNQAEKMFGYEREELLGESIEMLLPHRFQQGHVEHRNGYYNDPHLRPMGVGVELVGRRKDGSEFPVEISLSPVSQPGGMFISSVIRDVTERKAMEAELIAARQEAERANKANSAFLAAASHDLRQPVQALTLLHGALRRTVKDPLAMEMVESQQQSLDAMTNLLNSLLDISRLDAGAIEPEMEEFSMQRLFGRFSAEFARQAQHKGLEFHADDCTAMVRSDPNLLAEILQNLVSNAIRYTDKGTVTLSCHETSGCVRIDVRDTGIGIAEDQLEEIFQEFHQCKTPGSNKEGFGLGLAIVRRLAELLDHKITVESEPGRGSCFCVHVPTASGYVAGASEESDHADTAARPDVSGTVILIEDDIKVANAWGLLLEAEGYRVATAASAPEARAVVQHLDHPPVLIISDFHLLDGSTGVDAVKGIRKEFGRNIPAFIVSGDTSKVVDEARSLTNSVLMSKPVNTDLLLKLAHEAVATGLIEDD
ncbi:MAG: PAS domain S-box protein [Proteobacteria bacterium]|nr:PAS domain S-box protein [Pseudomonadota bacterium]